MATQLSSVSNRVFYRQTVTDRLRAGDDKSLENMDHVKDAGFIPEKGCLPGTRVEVMDYIGDWVFSSGTEGGQLFWLRGFAGSGKSAIALTLAQYFNTVGCLGSAFAFEVSRGSDRSSSALFRTIARNLADSHPHFKNRLSDILRRDSTLTHTPSVLRQFDELLLASAKGFDPHIRVVLVIDALDECGGGDPEARQVLLDVLATRCPHLPPNFRILLTSRPERNIEDSFRGNVHVTVLDLNSVDQGTVDADLTRYFERQLEHVVAVARLRIPELVYKSQGLFQWAFTTCQFILQSRRRGRLPAESLDIILSSPFTGLDSLYSEILNSLFGYADDPELLPRFHSVIGMILTVREPLSMSTLRALRGENAFNDTVGAIVQSMGSLLSGVFDDAPVGTLHASFREYLMDHNRGGIYHIDNFASELELACSTVGVMNSELKFNIGEFPSSHMSNDQVEGLRDRVRNKLSPAMRYSFRFWTAHLSACGKYNAALATSLREFAENKFLFWLELMSLLDPVYGPLDEMDLLSRWCEVGFHYDECL